GVGSGVGAGAPTGVGPDKNAEFLTACKEGGGTQIAQSLGAGRYDAGKILATAVVSGAASQEARQVSTSSVGHSASSEQGGPGAAVDPLMLDPWPVVPTTTVPVSSVTGLLGHTSGGPGAITGPAQAALEGLLLGDTANGEGERLGVAEGIRGQERQLAPVARPEVATGALGATGSSWSERGAGAVEAVDSVADIGPRDPEPAAGLGTGQPAWFGQGVTQAGGALGEHQSWKALNTPAEPSAPGPQVGLPKTGALATTPEVSASSWALQGDCSELLPHSSASSA
ncbi:unnamed protein product, partial [Discosporangium mesarthrocarpum]